MMAATTSFFCLWSFCSHIRIDTVGGCYLVLSPSSYSGLVHSPSLPFIRLPPTSLHFLNINTKQTLLSRHKPSGALAAKAKKMVLIRPFHPPISFSVRPGILNPIWKQACKHSQ
jgi:hypothetical protein